MQPVAVKSVDEFSEIQMRFREATMKFSDDEVRRR